MPKLGMTIKVKKIFEKLKKVLCELNNFYIPLSRGYVYVSNLLDLLGMIGRY